MAEKTLNDLFLDTLKDIYYAEKQILKALPKMARASQSEEGKAAFLFLRAEGRAEKAVQLEIGNPLTAESMTRHPLGAALYAPLRVLLYEDGNGKAVFEYDLPSCFFCQFGDPRVTAVGLELDRELEPSCWLQTDKTKQRHQKLRHRQLGRLASVLALNHIEPPTASIMSTVDANENRALRRFAPKSFMEHVTRADSTALA